MVLQFWESCVMLPTHWELCAVLVLKTIRFTPWTKQFSSYSYHLKYFTMLSKPYRWELFNKKIFLLSKQNMEFIFSKFPTPCPNLNKTVMRKKKKLLFSIKFSRRQLMKNYQLTPSRNFVFIKTKIWITNQSSTKHYTCSTPAEF